MASPTTTTTTTLAPQQAYLPGEYPANINSKEEKRMYDRTGIVALDLPTPEEQILNVKPYKVYVANITQTGSTQPIVKVLENTIGNIVWTYESVGVYTALINNSFDNAFDPDKTFVSLVNGNDAQSYAGASISDNGMLLIDTAESSQGSASDDILFNAAFEMRIYDAFTIAPTTPI